MKKEIDDILLYIFESNKIVKDEIRLKVKGIKNSINEYEETKLENIMYILSGYKGNALKIDDKFDKYEKCYINKLKSTEEDIDDFLIGIVELYDMAQIHKVLKIIIIYAKLLLISLMNFMLLLINIKQIQKNLRKQSTN